LLGALGLLLSAGMARAADAPSYTKDVKPFLAKYCTDCHNARKAKAGVNLEDFQALMKGGRKGVMVVPNKPDQSRLVRTMEGGKPVMPPRKYAQQPTRAEIALVRAWIAAGAKDDGDARGTDTGSQTRRNEETSPLDADVRRSSR
jgi:hypothetical protein